MSYFRTRARLLLAVTACIALGAGGSVIASAGAATGVHATKAKHARHMRATSIRRWAARSVHADLVVATSTGFATVTLDRGRVASVSGDRLTITEGTKKAVYRTVTLTIPAGAKVREDGRAASLSSLVSGERVSVIQAPHRTVVRARTAPTG